MTEDETRALCHEAGHAVVALHLGFYVERIAVSKGMRKTEIDLQDESQTISPLKRYIVLSGGIAGELSMYPKSAPNTAGSDQREISLRKGGPIKNYLPEALEIVSSNKKRFDGLLRQLIIRWVECRVNASWDNEPDSFELLSQSEIQRIWETPEKNLCP
jgi:hypothetical protein